MVIVKVLMPYYAAINVHISEPSVIGDHLSLPNVVTLAVEVIVLAPNCTKPPFTVIDAVDVIVP